MNELDELLSAVKKYVDKNVVNKAPWKPGETVDKFMSSSQTKMETTICKV